MYQIYPLCLTQYGFSECGEAVETPSPCQDPLDQMSCRYNTKKLLQLVKVENCLVHESAPVEMLSLKGPKVGSFRNSNPRQDQRDPESTILIPNV